MLVYYYVTSKKQILMKTKCTYHLFMVMLKQVAPSQLVVIKMFNNKINKNT